MTVTLAGWILLGISMASGVTAVIIVKRTDNRWDSVGMFLAYFAQILAYTATALMIISIATNSP